MVCWKKKKKGVQVNLYNLLDYIKEKIAGLFKARTPVLIIVFCIMSAV